MAEEVPQTPDVSGSSTHPRSLISRDILSLFLNIHTMVCANVFGEEFDVFIGRSYLPNSRFYT